MGLQNTPENAFEKLVYFVGEHTFTLMLIWADDWFVEPISMEYTQIFAGRISI